MSVELIVTCDICGAEEHCDKIITSGLGNYPQSLTDSLLNNENVSLARYTTMGRRYIAIRHGYQIVCKGCAERIEAIEQEAKQLSDDYIQNKLRGRRLENDEAMRLKERQDAANGI